MLSLGSAKGRCLMDFLGLFRGRFQWEFWAVFGVGFGAIVAIWPRFGREIVVSIFGVIWLGRNGLIWAFRWIERIARLRSLRSSGREA